MKIRKFSKKPLDISGRIGAKPVVCYPNNNIEEKLNYFTSSAKKFE
jgi:hypothetical protein